MHPFWHIRLVAGLLAVWCGSIPAGAAGETALAAGLPPADGSVPVVLKIGVNDIYCRQTACECIEDIACRSYDGVLKALAIDYRITLEFTYFMEVMDLEKAIRAQQFDGVLCKPWTALRLGEGRAFKRVVDVLDPDNQSLMTGLFVVPVASSLKSLTDVQGKRVAFGQPDSYEKYHAPLRQLAALGIKPAGGLFHSSCGENLDALMSGKVEVAVISSYALTASCAVDFAKPEDFRTIAATEPMPLTSLLVDLNKVNAAVAVRLQQALLQLSGDNVPKDLIGKGFVLPVSWKPLPVEEAAVPRRLPNGGP